MILIAGADASGALYGCLELAEQVRRAKALPDAIDLRDRPQMVLRGTCIGVQKPYYLPGRTVYEYPYTPETFPGFMIRNYGCNISIRWWRTGIIRCTCGMVILCFFGEAEGLSLCSGSG